MADIPEERSTGNASIPPQYIPVSSTKFEVEKFDGKGNFGMWKREVMDMLVQMNLDFTLEDKPQDLDDKNRERINQLACSSIRLCLVKD
jgi:cell division cycle protein 20 (cofactor of APC complex)